MQVVVLGPERVMLESALEAQLGHALRDVGMAPTDVVLLGPAQIGQLKQLDSRSPSAAVYLGGNAPGDVGEVATLLTELVPILPVVTNLTRVAQQLPASLTHLNAHPRDDGLPTRGLASVVSWILDRLGLVRNRRRAFVSYRRTESRQAALKLHEELEGRSWKTFLDTQSIDAGEPFQDNLHEQLADSDVLILLDTPQALGSRWVLEEVQLADTLRVGVLQVLWPGRERARGTEFATALYLESSDLDAPDRLKSTTIARICEDVEVLRARSVTARRRRLLHTFVRRARRRPGVIIEVHWPRFISLSRGPDSARLVTVVGHPTLDDLYAAAKGHPGAAILYDPREMLLRRQDVLAWQDRHPEVDLVSVTSADAWLEARFP